ncbi:MAG: element excision factor XisI family protein [Chloroflexota bacterium]
MDQIVDLTHIVQQQIEAYAKGGWAKARGYAITDAKRNIYTVIGVPDYPRKFPASIVVMARVENGKVIIEHDITDRPLWEELVRAGIPREQIILTYAGEQMPEAS